MSSAVVFDLDDTLYPERSYVDSGFVAVSAWAERALGIPSERGVEELRGLIEAGVRQRTFDRWLEGHGIDPDGHVPTMVRVYREHRPGIASFDGVPDLLRRVRHRHRIGILSDGYASVQRMKLEALGLEALVDAVVLTDELGPEWWKPNPAAFGILLGRLGVKAANSVYVADNPIKDFLGARRAGMKSVRVRSPLGVYSHLTPESPAHAPEYEIAGLDELEPLLERLWPAAGGSEGGGALDPPARTRTNPST